MCTKRYNKTIRTTVGNEAIDYGILYGNAKIVFIKVGAGGSIRGYRDKYLKMAHRIHERLGTTVICASNPDAVYEDQLTADQAMISQAAADCGFADYEIYLVGTSDGGYQNLLLAREMPQTVKLLSINASMIDPDDFIEKLREIPHVRKLLVYGTEDDACEFIPVLQALEWDNLEIKTVAGADHEFTGLLDVYIGLIDLL